MTLAVLTDDGLGLGVGQVLDALLRPEMKLDPVALVVSVDQAESMRCKAMHMTVGRGQAAIALEESGLAYQPRKVTLARGEQRTAEYLRLNPTGRVPALVDSDGPGGERLVLTQSNAIMLYIAEKAERSFPRAAWREPVRSSGSSFL